MCSRTTGSGDRGAGPFTSDYRSDDADGKRVERREPGGEPRVQRYWVRTATLVDPRITPPPSLNRTKIRFATGSNGTTPPPTKTPKAGVAFALICTVTVSVGAARHVPVAGLVAQMEAPRGR